MVTSLKLIRTPSAEALDTKAVCLFLTVTPKINYNLIDFLYLHLLLFKKIELKCL